MPKTNLFGKCPYVTSQKLLSGKWSIYILHLLSQKPIRFNEMLRLMPEEMTPTTLSRQLKVLEQEGLIVRTEFNETITKVEYSLSNIGEKFFPVLQALETWGKEYIDYMSDTNS